MRYFRKVIRITGHDSPNVRYAKAELAAGKQPSGKILVPGVLSWDDYQHRLATWDKVRLCVGIEAEFYEGAEILLFPPEWLNRADEIRRSRQGGVYTRYMGIDPAEGGDRSSWCIGDRHGVLKMLAMQTPNTTVVANRTLSLMREYGVEPQNVVFDLGGGGKEHADRLREQGHPVRTVAFGQAPSLPIRRGLYQIGARKEMQEDKYVYVNLRAEMYHEASLLLDPDGVDERGQARCYGIPLSGDEAHVRLRHQLAVLPRLTDGEGRYWMLPKNRKDPDQKVKTLVELIGHSPDEADSFVLMVHAMLHRDRRPVAGMVS